MAGVTRIFGPDTVEIYDSHLNLQPGRYDCTFPNGSIVWVNGRRHELSGAYIIVIDKDGNDTVNADR